MIKIRALFIFMAVYELFKISFSLVSRPIASIIALPFSWYAAAPLLILPLIALILLAVDPKKYCEYCFIIIISKIVFLLGILYFIADNFSLYLQNLYTIYTASSTNFLIFLLIFFIIDVILLIACSKAEKRIKSMNEDSEGCVCK